MTIGILFADDQGLVRAGFRKLLEAEPDIEVVGEADDGATAVRAAASLRPQVVLMDVRMPCMNGIEAARRIAAGTPGCPVVILTTYDLDEYVYDALRAGACGIVLKDASPEQLVSAMRLAASGDAFLAPSVTRRLIQEFAHRAEPDARLKEALAGLTSREQEVRTHLARGLGNGEIASRLFVGEATVKTHVANILLKLDLRDRVQAVIFAYESGFVTAGSEAHSGPSLTGPCGRLVLACGAHALPAIEHMARIPPRCAGLRRSHEDCQSRLRLPHPALMLRSRVGTVRGPPAQGSARPDTRPLTLSPLEESDATSNSPPSARRPSGEDC